MLWMISELDEEEESGEEVPIPAVEAGEEEEGMDCGRITASFSGFGFHRM